MAYSSSALQPRAMNFRKAGEATSLAKPFFVVRTLFALLINAMMLEFASFFVSGFEVRGLWPAFWGGLLLSILNMAVRQILKTPGE